MPNIGGIGEEGRRDAGEEGDRAGNGKSRPVKDEWSVSRGLTVQDNSDILDVQGQFLDGRQFYLV